MALFLAVFVVLNATESVAYAQQVVDKTVATVSDGVRTELITYSDLLWQLALQPGTPIDPPRKEDLNQALQTLIDQNIFALEAERLPRAAAAPAEIAEQINATLERFPSPAAFEARLKRVGFSSVKDEDFEALIARRIAIENYVDFRFRSFVVVSADEETKYYNEKYAPDFRRRFPGVVVPTLSQKRAEIHGLLSEQKVAARIETYLDEAKTRITVTQLIEP
ncbi:MAG: hypothetical protein JO053_05055 [Acidobacteria bacterium]|nr:hypothetical protein [Acidobacteriota bacterium]